MPFRTMRERYLGIQFEYKSKHKVRVEYSRVPLSTAVAITPERLNPVLTSLISFVESDKAAKDSAAIVCQCRAGTLRTVILSEFWLLILAILASKETQQALMMKTVVVASLVWVNARPESLPTLSPDEYHRESPDLEKGQYPAMMDLVESLPRSKTSSGHDRKAVLDWVIAGCSRLVDIRVAINTSKAAFEDSIVEESYGEESGGFAAQARREERSRNSRRAQLLMQDYMMLLLVEDYLCSKRSSSLSFSEWCQVERGEQVSLVSGAWVF